MLLRYWFKIQSEKIYIFKWEGFCKGNDIFSEIRKQIAGRFIVLEEQGGKEVFGKNLNGKVYIVFRKPNNVQNDKYLSRKRCWTSRTIILGWIWPGHTINM